jgi:hypothetical protein
MGIDNMSTLKEKLIFLDTIMNKKKHEERYLVLHEGPHNLWVIDPDGKEEPKQIPKRFFNMTFMKIDPMVMKVLYGKTTKESSESKEEIQS